MAGGVRALVSEKTSLTAPRLPKVISFDGWTKSIHHFAPLVPVLRERGFAFTFVHIGSWGNDPGRPPRETLQGIEVRDLSSYGTSRLDALLDAERPAAVIFLSTQTFSHRAMLRYCRQRGIPTLNLYHGLAYVADRDSEAGAKKIDRWAYTRFVASKTTKLVTRVFPAYVGALARTGASSADWRRFLADTARLATGRHTLTASDDARTTRCAVYTEPDRAHAVRTYGFAEGDVRAVGNPDLIRFGVTGDLISSRVMDSPAGKGSVLYINTGTFGRVFRGPAAFVDHLIATERAVASEGYQLTFKPHHSVPQTLLDDLTRRSSIQIISNSGLVDELRVCAACIVEITTLAMAPALMGIPLLLGQYNALAGMRFGPVLLSYPRAAQLTDLGALRTTLSEASSGDAASVREWIRLNAGPLPAEAMPARVADLIAEMATPHVH